LIVLSSHPTAIGATMMVAKNVTAATSGSVTDIVRDTRLVADLRNLIYFQNYKLCK
jgi:hypothetical protein